MQEKLIIIFFRTIHMNSIRFKVKYCDLQK